MRASRPLDTLRAAVDLFDELMALVQFQGLDEGSGLEWKSKVADLQRRRETLDLRFFDMPTPTSPAEPTELRRCVEELTGRPIDPFGYDADPMWLRALGASERTIRFAWSEAGEISDMKDRIRALAFIERVQRDLLDGVQRRLAAAKADAPEEKP